MMEYYDELDGISGATYRSGARGYYRRRGKIPPVEYHPIDQALDIAGLP